MKQKRKKLMIKIILAVLILIVLAVIIFTVVKMRQLGNLEKMDAKDAIHYVTEYNENIKISIAVIKDDNVTYQVYGKNGKQLDDTDYDYEIGSISKTFVGLLISKAIAENKISLNSSISEYLSLDDSRYYPTIERLITHTSGYKSYYFDKQMVSNTFHQDNDFYGISKERLLEKVKTIDLEDKDYSFKYSNFGISILGLVLEEVYQRDFVTLMNDYIVRDLTLSSTKTAACTGNLNNYWQWQADDGYIPAGAIISNIEDMAAYLSLYMTDDQNYITDTYTSIKAISASNTFYDKLNIRMDEAAMTWLIDKSNDIIWHNGGTSHYNSYIAFNREKQIGVVILGNTSPTYKLPMTVIGVKLINELCREP